MMTACLHCSFSSDFAIKAPDCFSSSFFPPDCLFPPVSSSLHHNLLSTLPFPSLHLSLHHLANFRVSLSSPLYLSIFCLPLFLSWSLSLCAYMFVKIYWSPVVPSHSHACSVSLSHSSVHKTHSLWTDIKEKGRKGKREKFSTVP